MENDKKIKRTKKQIDNIKINKCKNCKQTDLDIEENLNSDSNFVWYEITCKYCKKSIMGIGYYEKEKALNYAINEWNKQ